jgi:tRNA (guanine37-N1)-methyltransferase
MLSFDVLTIFPKLVQDAVDVGLLAKACQTKKLQIHAHDMRAYTEDKHRRVDDEPYGGGAGMVMKVEPIVKALEALAGPKARRIILSPRGPLLTQEKVRALLAHDEQIILVCGRYEGIDERVLPFVDEELSIGDYILAGGEYAALVVIDAVARLIPGVVGDADSLVEESLEQGVLEYPHYTRPREYRGLQVPDILLSGDHQKIAAWRKEQSEELTRKRRPDLLKKGKK